MLTTTCEGWLLDLYADALDGAVLWLIEAGGRRRRLRQDFPVSFYAAGPRPRLRALWRYLQAQPIPVKLERQECGGVPPGGSAFPRRDLFQAGSLEVLAIEVPGILEQERLFSRTSQDFPDLTYYDADISLPLRHAARYGTFPLARLRVSVDEQERVRALEALDTPWELDPERPRLRILHIEPNCDPRRASPTCLRIYAGGHSRAGEYSRCEQRTYCLSLEPARPLLANVAALLRQYDPDVIQTAWGDTWMLPYLLELAKRWGMELPLNREAGREPVHKREFTYYSYGQVIHRGQQVHLFGRWHIDVFNAMLFHDYGLEGVLESARVSASPAQSAARLSPGSGISAMQVVTALRQGVLVPWHKQQAEEMKSALELIRADQGGLVYQPTPGLHRDVVELDFVSMYPSIMVHFNISPETVVTEGPRGSTSELLRAEEHLQVEDEPQAEQVPALKLRVRNRAVEYNHPSGQEGRGLIPQTLAPLLEKRIALKKQLMTLPAWDPRRRRYSAQASAHKWLLVTCFGYLGYKNARFGRIEAHEAVTAYGREALLRAKEAAEDLGYEVLHMYVDGLWVRKRAAGYSRTSVRKPASQPAGYCPDMEAVRSLLDEIAERTRLPIALEGIYRWVAFLPSRVNPAVPVANRYFGVFQDGTLKVRGIEARRRDTPPFIAQAQMEILERLAQAPDAGQLPEQLPAVIALLRRRLRALRAGRLPAEQLLVTQKLSRELELYRTPSPAARAAAQLAAVGKTVRPGQGVRFLYMRGEPGVHAWDLPQPPNLAAVDTRRYGELLVRAASTVLQPIGVSDARLRDWIFSNAGYESRPGELKVGSMAEGGYRNGYEAPGASLPLLDSYSARI